MSRVKRGKIANKRRKNILKYTRGFRGHPRRKFRAAKEALLHAWTHAFRGRKEKKRNMRALWQNKINAQARANGISFSQLIHKLKQKRIGLNRKVLSEIAQHHPDIFSKIIAEVKK